MGKRKTLKGYDVQAEGESDGKLGGTGWSDDVGEEACGKHDVVEHFSSN